MNRSSLSEYLAGKSFPNLRNVRAIAKAFGTLAEDVATMVAATQVTRMPSPRTIAPRSVLELVRELEATLKRQEEEAPIIGREMTAAPARGRATEVARSSDKSLEECSISVYPF